MMLFLYGALLRECASDVLSKDLVQSVTLFRKATGVYHSLAHEVLPSLQPALPPERPPKTTSSVSSVMSLICLAEAQVRGCFVIWLAVKEHNFLLLAHLILAIRVLILMTKNLNNASLLV